MGNDLKTNGHYLSIPVDNGHAEYNEHYALLSEQYDHFISDASAAVKFVEECRARLHDDQLIYGPSENRGEPL